MAIAGDNALLLTGTYQKTPAVGATGAETPLAGAAYYNSLNYFTTPVNGITRGATGAYDTFVSGDTAVIRYYLQSLTAGTAPTVEIAPTLLSAVFSALNV